MFGAGSIAPHHAAAWNRIDEVEIVAVVDRDTARSQALIDDFEFTNARAFGSIDEAVSAVQPSFVDIATPPDLHVEHVTAVAAHGIDILCQKPFTPTLAQARQLVALCEGAGVRCVVNENWRWRSWYREIGRLVSEGVIGRPRYASFTCHRDLVLPTADGALPALLERQPYTRTMEQLIVLEWGIHLIDVLRFVFGPINSVSATIDSVSPLVVGEDRALVNLGFEAGVTGLIDISWSSRIRDERRMIRGNVEPMVIEGEEGTIELDPFTGDQLMVTTGSGTKSYAARGDRTPAEAYQQSFDACQRHFVEQLLSGSLAENEASDNLKTLEVALAVYESAGTGERILL
jgi:predicted dehydrogenase